MRVQCLSIGGANLDETFDLAGPAVPATSNPGAVRDAAGGVARNVAEALARLGVTTGLLAAIGDDAAGSLLRAGLEDAGIDTGLLQTVRGAATDRYLAVLDPAGELVIGVNAMRCVETITAERIAAAPLGHPTWVFAECNLSSDTLRAVARRCAADGFRLAVDLISVPKSTRARDALDRVDLVFGNVDEANAVTGLAAPRSLDGAALLAERLVAMGAGAAVVTAGAAGAAWHDGADAGRTLAAPARVRDVTGAGDALIAATIARLLRGGTLEAAVADGVRAAALAVASPTSVPAGLDPERLAGADAPNIREQQEPA